MSVRWTAILVVVLAGLSGLYWATGRPQPTSEGDTVAATRVFDVDVTGIVGLTVAPSDAVPVEALRDDDGGWNLAPPHESIGANAAAWDRVAAAIASLTNERPIEGTFEGSGIYGLDPPALSVTVATGNSIEQVDFGALEPTQTYRYARLASEGIFLASAGVFEQLNKQLSDLRDRRVFDVGEAGIARIEYEAAANSARPEPFRIELAKEGDEWMIVDPVRVEASPIHAGRLAAALEQLQGRTYIDTPTRLEDYGLAFPFATITVRAAGADADQVLHVGWLDDSDERGGLFAKRANAPGVVVVDARMVTLLPETVEGMRERRLFTRDAVDLESISYTDPVTAFELALDAEGAWQLVDPPADDTDSLAVSAFVAVLKRVEAVGFPTANSVDAANARFAITFGFTDGDMSTVRIGGPVPDTDPVQFYAWQEDGTLVALPLEAVVLLQADPFHFRDRRLLRFDPDTVANIALSLDGIAYTLIRDDNGRWSVESPSGMRFESQDDARAIVETLAAAKADVLLTVTPDIALTRLDDPVLRVTVGYGDSVSGTNAQTRTLTVGALSTPQSRQRFVSHESDSETYLADQRLIDDLRAAFEGVISARP